MKRAKAKTTPPTPAEIRAAREKAGLEPAEAAAVLEYTERAWHQWEAGTRPMRRPLFDHFKTKTKAKAKRGSGRKKHEG